MKQTYLVDNLLGMPAFRFIVWQITLLRSHQIDQHDNDLKQQIRDRLSEWTAALKDSGWQVDHIQWALYAVCAGVDEAIMQAGGQFAERWAGYPLQMEFFGEYTAGQGFYERLKTIRQSAQVPHLVLFVYWLMLTHGFEGQLAWGVKGERLELIEHIRQELVTGGVLKTSGMVDVSTPQALKPLNPLARFLLPGVWLLTIAVGIGVYEYFDQQLNQSLAQFIKQHVNAEMP